MMESIEDSVRVKKEPNEGDDYKFDLVDSCKAENFETFTVFESSASPMNEAMASHEKLDEKVLVDFECKDVKLELMPPSTTICKNEYQNVQPVVKIEKENQTDARNGNISKPFGPQINLKKHINTVHDRSKPFECEICHKSFGRKHHLEHHIRTVHNQSKPFKCEICHKSFGLKSPLQRHIKAVHDQTL